MLRNKNLIPLSHQHQHALAFCVKVDKALASPAAMDTAALQQAIAKLYEDELAIHFEAEEKFVFPAAEQVGDLASLVDELRIEHGVIRRGVKRAETRDLTVSDIQVFAASLSAHIRKEERQLFEVIQERLSAEELDTVGREIERLLPRGQRA
ncbi:MAG TPA: hemerythrin domain-containing protein [Terriglobales bacterium]|nr:hemerythrin domain-containing protein [Terriglobales bacterium]